MANFSLGGGRDGIFAITSSKHREGALSLSYGEPTRGEQDYILSSYLTRVLHTARISNVMYEMKSDGGLIVTNTYSLKAIKLYPSVMQAYVLRPQGTKYTSKTLITAL